MLSVEQELRQRQLERLIDQWHESPPHVGSLPAFLEITPEQYARWAAGHGLPADWTPPATKETPMPLEAAVPAEKPDEIYADLSDMRLQYQHYEYLLEQHRLITEAIDQYKKKFQQAIEAVPGAVGFEVDGVKRYTYKPTGTFPHAKFAAAHPGIAAAYTKMVEKFDVETFAKLNPALYDQWRPRRFVAVTGKQD